jgi:uncharacterized membrane protein
LFGPGELALRLVPIVASLVGMVLYRQLALDILPPWPACIAVGLFAFSPVLVYYSSEAKQYAVDVTAAIVAAGVFFWLIRSPIGWGRALTWGSACAIAIWFSFEAFFVAGAATIAAAWCLYLTNRRRELVKVGAASVVWLVSLGLEYAVSLRPLHSNAALASYWHAGFAPRPLALNRTLSWLRATTDAAVHDPAVCMSAGWRSPSWWLDSPR